MDKAQIRYILEISRIEKWPYSRIFETFKDAGVDTYVVKLDTFEITYFGSQKTLKGTISLNLLPLKINNIFSPTKLEKIWDRHQKGKTTYTMFLHAAASAGVLYYRVDLCNGTITFYGINKQHREYIV